MTNLNIFSILWIINILMAITTVFWSKRQVSTIWAWLFFLIFVPYLGFVVYWFTARRISNKQIFKVSSQKNIGLKTIENNAVNLNNIRDEQILKTSKLLSQMDQTRILRNDNHEIFTNGSAFFESLIDDIRNAKHHIHLEFFTIYDDHIGNKIIDELTAKAKEGVEVKIIYDQFGSKGRNEKMYSKLVKNNGIAVPFLMRNLQLLTFRLNFRLHRKIVVIDGNVSYIGGFNIGDQYLGKKKKFGNWRDTQIRLNGDISLSLQNRFVSDWNATTNKNEALLTPDSYFPDRTEEKKTKSSLMQFISSGPDSDIQKIKLGYLDLINQASEEILIQTPYLIPDESILNALKSAVLSGVKVKIMIPSIADHPFVYSATRFYASDLNDSGVEIYSYENGFIHAKTMVIDKKISSIGSANMDIRSFELNFEANVFIYNEKISRELSNIFDDDLIVSKRLDSNYFKERTFFEKIKSAFSRLLSPIL